MRIFAAGAFAALFFVTTTSFAADLTGRWQFLRQGHNGTYFGNMVIDGAQVRLKGTGLTQNYAECGKVQANGNNIEIVFSFAKAERGYAADHFYCTLSGGGLTCNNRDAAGNGGTVFNITRIGALPASGFERLDDACQPNQKPWS